MWHTRLRAFGGSVVNKTTEVLRHLREYGSITSDEAWRYFGATRLSAIIFRLRRKGHEIETVMCDMRDRYGSPVKFARYCLRDKDE